MAKRAYKKKSKPADDQPIGNEAEEINVPDDVKIGGMYVQTKGVSEGSVVKAVDADQHKVWVEHHQHKLLKYSLSRTEFRRHYELIRDREQLASHCKNTKKDSNPACNDAEGEYIIRAKVDGSDRYWTGNSWHPNRSKAMKVGHMLINDRLDRIMGNRLLMPMDGKEKTISKEPAT
jgi:hypothetical protein